MSNSCPFDKNKNCLKPKSIHVTELINGEFKEFHLCEDCPKESPSIIGTLQQILSDPFGHFFKILKAQGEMAILEKWKRNPCPQCNITLIEILNLGKVGCGNCYDYFNKELSPVIHAVQAGNLRHQGKSPKVFKQIKDIKILEEKMNNIIKEEKYEEAAKIRDLIKELKSSENKA